MCEKLGLRMPQIPGLKVIRSPIHGYGVVATRAYAPGDVIADVEGVLYREEDVADGADTYCLWIDDGWYMDMVDQTRWINHACDPNAEIDADLIDGGRGGAWARIVAIKPIAPGDEITYDYAFAAPLAEPCGCRSPGCRGWIVDPDEVDRVPPIAAIANSTRKAS
jgi:SET domain-containing protein